jgi:ABC-2 type transport system permease protein
MQKPIPQEKGALPPPVAVRELRKVYKEIAAVDLIVMSWSLGLISTGVVLRWGLGAESFAWLIVFVLLPICCVYYPVTTLPGWLQPVALALPPTYVFEGLRAIVLEGAFVGYLMVKALALNVVYFIAGFAVFAYFLRSARIHGTLVQMGE